MDMRCALCVVLYLYGMYCLSQKNKTKQYQYCVVGRMIRTVTDNNRRKGKYKMDAGKNKKAIGTFGNKINIYFLRNVRPQQTKVKVKHIIDYCTYTYSTITFIINPIDH
jgi:hypothetical protein